ARRGAKVVVNDLGGTARGEGQDLSVAERTVEEIKAAGGEALANTNSVVQGEKLVEAAIEAYGQVDIIINNAGILRDVAFHKMSEDDWRLMFDVHVHGAYAVTRAAWPLMRERGYGRIVNTTSGAGLHGNFGQVNYSAAKLAVYGMARSLAAEGAAKGIFVNTIAPAAASRMTETVMPPAMLKALKPELVTPLVVLLCHENSQTTGDLFEVGGGWVSQLRWQGTEGAAFDAQKGFSPEELQAQWTSVTNFDDAYNPADVTACLTRIGRNIGVDLSFQKQ
ncbi:MAG: SDR family oxidoreductase, partial [Pseudomonadota bacterium]